MPTLRELGLETYEVRSLHRSELTGAPYNPRQIGEAEKRKLKTALKKHGLVAPITWNARTGHIVGGHRRIEQLDKLTGSADYELNVAAIDVDEGREKELNILLNNEAVQGDWDLEKLGELLKLPEIDLAGAGFEHGDLYRLFGDDSVIYERGGDALDELAAKLRDFRNAYENISRKGADRASEEYYLVVVFRDPAQCSAFIAHHRLTDNRYQNGETLMALTGMDESPARASPASPPARPSARDEPSRSRR